MSTIIINGNTYSGNSIVVTNGKVIINGKDVTPDGKEVVVLYEVINIDDKGNVVNDGYIELKVEIGEFKKLNSKLVSPQTEY